MFALRIVMRASKAADARAAQACKSLGGHDPHRITYAILQGACRSLAAVSDDLVLRIESGDASVLASEWPSALLVASGRNLFQLIRESVAHAARLSGEARPLHEKSLPDSLNYFGWCTWDAFYSMVSAQVCCFMRYC